MRTRKLLPLALVAAATSLTAHASSHREAPFIAQNPSVDGTDFYMFRSYETGRAGYVTFLANYNPLQDSYGGPNYFALNPNALYEIQIDNTGSGVESLTFQFRFTNTFAGLTATGAPAQPITTANPATGANLPIPLVNLPPNSSGLPTLNRTETYTVDLIRGPRRGTAPSAATKLTSTTGGATTFTKPVDNIGTKSIPNYASYVAPYIYTVNIPGCTAGTGRVFVGQRKEGFAVNLGEVFDLINLNPLGARTGRANVTSDKNITTLALEVPVACLTTTVTVNGAQVPEPVIGAWTSSSLRQARVLNPTPQGPARAAGIVPPEVVGGAWTQVSRLGAPLVNEVVIGITDKDRFNSSNPSGDVATFANYVLTPTLPVLVNALFQVPPPATPRIDLLNAFVTGIQATLGTGANAQTINFTHPQNVLLASPFTGAGEMLRLNTAFPTAANAVAPVPTAAGDLGFLACDLNGFPNGRRPIDDVVDIELSVAEGALTGANGGILQTCDLSSGTPTVHAGGVVTDGVRVDPTQFLAAFPYLGTPLPGSPNGPASNGQPANQ